MSDTGVLRAAAQAVLDRWDSPQWEWCSHGPTADLMHALRAAMAQQQAPTPQPLVLIGIGKINGDGWKDTTRIGDVVYVWNRELPEPHSPGQFPRVGYPIWSASTTQYDFRPVADDVAIAVIDRTIEELRMEVATLKDRAAGIGAAAARPDDPE